MLKAIKVTNKYSKKTGINRPSVGNAVLIACIPEPGATIGTILDFRIGAKFVILLPIVPDKIFLT